MREKVNIVLKNRICEIHILVLYLGHKKQKVSHIIFGEEFQLGRKYDRVKSYR